jgi:hypothetical protein
MWYVIYIVVDGSNSIFVLCYAWDLKSVCESQSSILQMAKKSQEICNE